MCLQRGMSRFEASVFIFHKIKHEVSIVMEGDCFQKYIVQVEFYTDMFVYKSVLYLCRGIIIFCSRNCYY